MKPEFEQYQVTPEALLSGAWIYGGYEAMEFITQTNQWYAVPSWGKSGWDLGSWPLVMVFFRECKGTFDVATYCEGDISQYACPTPEIRNAITDDIAFFHWKWVAGYETVEQLPPELRGPYGKMRKAS